MQMAEDYALTVLRHSNYSDSLSRFTWLAENMPVFDLGPFCDLNDFYRFSSFLGSFYALDFSRALI